MPLVETTLSVLSSASVEFWSWLDSHPTLIPTLFGTFFGFSLSQGATYHRDKAIVESQAKSVRKMLNIEIDHNLTLLRNWIDDMELKSASLTQCETPTYTEDFSITTIPSWHQKVFESQIGMLPKALDEEKIQGVFSLYTYLCSEMETQSDEVFKWKLKVMQDCSNMTNLVRLSHELNKMLSSAKNILASGNPVEKNGSDS